MFILEYEYRDTHSKYYPYTYDHFKEESESKKQIIDHAKELKKDKNCRKIEVYEKVPIDF